MTKAEKVLAAMSGLCPACGHSVDDHYEEIRLMSNSAKLGAPVIVVTCSFGRAGKADWPALGICTCREQPPGTRIGHLMVAY